MGLSPGGQEFYGDINGLEPFEDPPKAAFLLA
jgi:hypothetical protein